MKVTAGMLVVMAVTGAYLAGTARAAGIPITDVLFYSGVIDNDGALVDDPLFPIAISLWDLPAGGSVAVNRRCDTGNVTTAVVNGRFRITLPDDCAIAVQDNPELYAEVFARGEILGRTKLGAVPYAVEAKRAEVAGDAAPASALGTRLASLETGRVSSPVGGGAVVVGALIAADTTLTVNDGGFIASVDSSANATYDITFAPGAFSTAPVCTATVFSPTSRVAGVLITTLSVSGLSYFITDPVQSNAENVLIMCVGGR